MSFSSLEDVAARLDRQDWSMAEVALQQHGYAVLPKVMAPREAETVVKQVDDASLFLKHVVMARHGYGQVDYKYFGYPLPEPIKRLRAAHYRRLLPTARAWAARLGEKTAYPDGHDAFLSACHNAGQERPTCLILRYRKGDYNRLHQDLYGEIAFPLQAAVLLSEPGEDFTGGEFVLTEHRARMQSRAEVVPLRQGDAVVFANALRPIDGARGAVRVNMRHGVSPLRGGQRFALGLILHDAK